MKTLLAAIVAMTGLDCAALSAGDAPRPNLLLILADDMGYSDLGCYGSEVETPRLDALAAEGLRFTGFYNAVRCCPTRVSLLTGLYPHEAGMGGMVSVGDKGKPGPYQGYLNARCRTLAEVLKPAGYGCYLAGKWHVGESRPHWPVNRGFDHSYGLISGGMNYFDLTKGKSKGIERVFARDGERIVPEPGEFYATDAFTDAALGFINRHHAGGNPFFLALTYTAPHWPLHAPEELIRKYEARYLGNFGTIREARHRKQISLGIVDADHALSPRDGTDWESLAPEKQHEMARKMAVYAAMIERMDWNIGRVIDRLREQGQLANTVILFLSDNGASAEGGELGSSFRPDLNGPIGTIDSYYTYGQSWANVSNTPLRRFKSLTYEGGMRSPAIVHWPAGLKRPGGSIDHHTVAHVIDIMPTFAELAGAILPATGGDTGLTPFRGISLVPALHGGPPKSHANRALGWEHFGAAAWRQGNWKLVRKNAKSPWELYDLSSDSNELDDLAAKQGERTAAMRKAWQKWAVEIGVQ